MAYSDLVEFDEAMDLKEMPLDEVNFMVKDGDVVANFAGTQARISNSLDIFSKTFGIPQKFAGNMLEINRNTLANVMTDLARNEGPRDFRWGIAGEKLVSCGPSRKPHVPFTLVGDSLVNKGFELKGDLGKFGEGIITATHPHEARVEPRQDDILASGVRVEMSPLMIENPVITPWSERLWCTNGCTTIDDRERISVLGHDVESVMGQIDNVADEAFKKAEAMNYSFADMTGTRIDVFRALSHMASAHHIPRKLVEEMMERAGRLGENEQTMYDALNIFTEVSRDIDDVQRRGWMQSMAGRIISEESLRCDTCGSHLH